MMTVIMAGSPCSLRAAAPGGRGRAEDDVVADGEGLFGGEHEGRQVLAAEPGGLVQAVAAVDQHRAGLPGAVGGDAGDDQRLVQVGGHRVLRVEVRAGADQRDRVRAAAGAGSSP